MRFLINVIFFQVAFFTALNAQKGEVSKGYIIDNEGQKIEGFIQHQKRIDNEIKVRFSEEEKSKKFSLYKPKDISAYGFEDTGLNNMKETFTYERHFEKYELDRPAKIFASNTSMIERVVEGHYTVYMFEYESAADIETPISKRYIITRDNKEFCQVGDDSFEEASKSLFEGYTSLLESIGKVKFRYKNFTRLVDDYNYWMEVQHHPGTYKMNPKIYKQ